MSKQWYYQVMGAEVGPISSAELKQRVQRGQVQPDTLLRLGPDGKWQSADRVKGLLDPPPVPPAPSAPPANTVADRKQKPESSQAHGSTPGPGDSPTPTASHSTAGEKTYHLAGDDKPGDEAEEEQPREFDFFQFVGFEQAIGTALHQALHEHCRKHHHSLTHVTRRALAELLGRKDLIEENPPRPDAASPEQPTPTTTPIN